jgi:hypothetical protein
MQKTGNEGATQNSDSIIREIFVDISSLVAPSLLTIAMYNARLSGQIGFSGLQEVVRTFSAPTKESIRTV